MFRPPAWSSMLAVWLLATCVVSGADGPEPAPGSLLTWYRGADPVWTVRLSGPPDEPPAELLAPPWFRPVPPLSLTALDGTTLDLAVYRGQVLALGFWATWCRPCIEELPRLQRLHTALHDRGFAAITVNAQEPDAVVRDYAEAIELRLPIARYDAALHRVFRVETLPTLVLLDRSGKMRERWVGAGAGKERPLERRVRALLDGTDPAAAPRRVADVQIGAGQLRGLWTLGRGPAVEALAVAPVAEGGPRVLFFRDDRLVLREADGSFLRRAAAAPAAGSTRLVDLNGDGHPEVLGFRPGGSAAVTVDAATGEASTWSTPSPVLDLVPLPPDGVGPAGILLACTGGLYRTDGKGGEAQLVGRPQETRSAAVATSSPDGTLAVLALRAAGRLEWLDLQGVTVREQPVPESSWLLLAAESPEDGWGVAADTVTDFVFGRFLPGAGRQVALVASGELVVVDTTGGRVRFRARWEQIRHVASGDLGGDGLDELLVAAGNAVTVLTAAGRSDE